MNPVSIYSYWVFGLTLLWSAGLIPFSPLLSAVVTFIGSIIFTGFEFNMVNVFVVATHMIPLWILRRTTIDILPNVFVFLFYNLFLIAMGTNSVQVYKFIFEHKPASVMEYLCQRHLC
jgi:hypothetical protein